jgi:hypothetical protein
MTGGLSYIFYSGERGFLRLFAYSASSFRLILKDSVFERKNESVLIGTGLLQPQPWIVENDSFP